jgi:hypothetical protein
MIAVAAGLTFLVLFAVWVVLPSLLKKRHSARGEVVSDLNKES